MQENACLQEYGAVAPCEPAAGSAGSFYGSYRSRFAAVILFVLVVLYASLLPFDFAPSPYQAADAYGLWQLRVVEPPLHDIVTNILVYMPLGFLLVYGGRSRGGVGRVLAAVLVGASVSCLAEVLQTGIVSRVASHTDVLLNGIGAAIGAVAGIAANRFGARMRGRLRAAIQHRPFALAAGVLTIGLFLYNLAPFDFITSTAGLHESFGRARWNVLGTAAVAIGDPPFSRLVGQISGAAWFVLLGYVVSLAGREAGRHPVPCFVSAIKSGAVLIWLIELMQLLTMSHVFDLSSVVLRFLGVGFGAWCAVFIVDQLTRSQWRFHRKLAVPTLFVGFVLAFQLSLRLIDAADHSGWSLAAFESSTISWWPLESYWRQSLSQSFAGILSAIVVHGTMAATIALLVLRLGYVGAWWVAGAAVTLVSVGTEFLRAATFSHSADLTGPVLAVVSAFFVVRTFLLIDGTDAERAVDPGVATSRNR